MPGGAGGQQPPGAPIDHQQQQQQMMMRQQQQMAYMQQQQAGMRGGMLPPGMQQQQQSQHAAMMQQQNMYGMQPGQQPQPGQPVDPAQLQQMRARQAQMQQMAQQNPHAHQQMLERFRNMSEEQRQAMMLQRQQQQQMAAARGGAGYPPGMQQTPGGPMGGGHLGGPPQQPGSSGMGVMAAGGPGGSGAGGGGGLPSHYIKQEPLGGPGGAAGMGGMMGHPGGPQNMMQIKQEQGMHNIKQEPGAGPSSMGAMQHQQHPGAAAASDDSPQAAAMQHMQQQPPANMARMQHARQQAMRQQQQQAAAAAAAAMQGGAVDPSMTVQQHLAAKQAAAQQQQAASAAGGGHNMPPGMHPQQMDPMMAQRHHQQLIFQQHQATMAAQQQGMTMQQMQQQRHMIQQQQQAAAASSMGPPSQMQLQQQQAAPPAAAAAPAAPPVDEEEVKEFKRSVENLKEKYGQTVERMIKRAAPGENMPRFINLCKEFFDGSRPYSPENLKTAKRLERDMDSMLERQSVTAGITMALDVMAREEGRRKEQGEMEEKPASSSSSSSTRMSLLPSPWPLDVRARRVRVPDALSRHVRSRRMDERLISRRKRHADVMRDEEDLPLWSARRMRHEPDLDAELEEMERMEPPKKDYKIAAEPDLPPPVVNSIPRGDAMEQALKRRQSGQQQQSRLHAKMPEEAMKELSVLRWRLVSDARLNFAETITFMVAIAAGHTQAVPPLHVLIHADYPERPASVLFEKSFPKSHPGLRRLGDAVEARLAAAPLSVQGRISTMAEIYKSACEAFFARGAGGPSTKMSVLQQSGGTRVKTEPLDQSTPSPDSASSSTSTSPADPSALPPTIPMLSHLPTTYRPQAKFCATVDSGNAKSRMVY